MFLFYSLQFSILTFLSLQDIRTKHISLWGVILFIAVAFFGLRALHVPVNYEMALLLPLVLFLIKISFYLFVGKTIIGNGDLFLLIPLLLSIHLEELPLFLIFAGLSGLLSAKILSSQQVPFVPSLSLAYGSTIILRFLQ